LLNLEKNTHFGPLLVQGVIKQMQRKTVSTLQQSPDAIYIMTFNEADTETTLGQARCLSETSYLRFKDVADHAFGYHKVPAVVFCCQTQHCGSCTTASNKALFIF